MKSPFKFLEAYSKQDKDIFFGRDKEINQIYEKLFDSNLLLVYGASGTGKTSIVNCGIANKFEETDWFPLHLRRKNHIIDSISSEIAKLALTPVTPGVILPDAVHSLYLDYFKPVCLIFDQFEELFISGDDNEKQAFLTFLSAILKQEYNVKVIIVIREEYIAHFNMFEEKIPAFFDNRFRVEHMTIYKAEEVIKETCKKIDIDLEDDNIPKAILQNISAQKKGVELTYLQVYMDRLYNFFKTRNPGAGQVVFSNKLIGEIGTIDDVLALFLEEQINKLEEPDLAWNILKAFVTSGGTKKTTSVNMVQNFMKERKFTVSAEKIDVYTKKFLELKIIKYLDE